MATTVPGYSLRKRSSHATLSASRWLVGSSSSSRSGFWSRSRQSATRLTSPPESVVTSASPGGQRSASMAISTVRSRSQPFAASIASCTRACSSSTFSISSGSRGSPSLALISSKRVRSPAHLGHAVLHVAAHVLGRVEVRLLRQVAGAHAVGGLGLAQEVLVHPRHDLEQGALARAVGAEHADLGPGVERQPDALEDLALGRDDLSQVLHRENELVGHRVWIIPGAA